MKVLFIDAFSGVSGDKFNAALLSAGADKDHLIKNLSSLSIKDEFELMINVKKINGINSLKFDVMVKQKVNHKHNLMQVIKHGHSHHSRNLNDIIEIINNSKITDNAKKISIALFKILGKAEASAHDVSIDKVHFHEVGAVDSITDIVSAAVMIDQLKFDKIISTPIPTGKGFVKTQHGLLPVPAPATAEILKGVPVYSTDIEFELTTPTGAAIIKYLTDEFGQMPQIKVNSIGYGAGSKDLNIPNFLRVFFCEDFKNFKSENKDIIVSLQTNIDDCTPEQLSFLSEKLFELGALDVFITPIIMKKSRQAQLLTVLCSIEDKEKFEKEIFYNSTTFGIRVNYYNRTVLKREFKTINIDGIEVTVKLGYFEGKLIQKSLEYESVKKAVNKLNISYNEFINKANIVLKDLNV